jgi:protein involved in polysaccharide export with SLBB domain
MSPVALALFAALLATPSAAPALAASTPGAEETANRTPSSASLVTPDFGAPLPGVIDPERYYVGPGDRFTLWVWGAISRAQPLVVGPEGDVVIPEIGSVNVAGKSLAQARRLIRERVQKTLRNLQVDLQLSRLRTFRVYLTGAVAQPGPVLANGVTRVVDLLPDTLLLAGASRRSIQVRRADSTLLTVDLQGFQLTGEDTHDPWLREGDVIHVPVATRFIGAWGAVGKPGSLELAEGDSVSTLLRLAGGVLPKVLGEEASLVRWRDGAERETLAVRIVDGKVTEGDGPLRDGDQLYLVQHPGWHESMHVWVVGRVPREGVFPIRLGTTRLSQAVAAAGGLLEDADASAIHLVRIPGGTTADPEFDRLLRLSREDMTRSEYESFRAKLAARSPDIRVDWTLIEQGRTDLDLLLQDADVIRIERRTNAVRVDGQVRRPGLVPYEAGRSFDWYVEQAGGYTNRASSGHSRVTRAANGQGMLARDVAEISPGDQLWIPEKTDTSAWYYISQALIVAAQLATVWLAVRPL